MAPGIRRVAAGDVYISDGERRVAPKGGVRFPAETILSFEEVAELLVELGGYKPPKKRRGDET